MRPLVSAAMFLGVASSGCAGISQTPAPWRDVSAASPESLKSQPLFTPSYILFYETGYSQSFEVNGRRRFNATEWKSSSTCNGVMKRTFSHFASTGSIYSVTPIKSITLCNYTVTTPHGRSGSLPMYYQT